MARVLRFLIVVALLVAMALLARHFFFAPRPPAGTASQPATSLSNSKWSAEVQENVDRFQNKIDASYQGSLDLLEPSPAAE